MECAVTHTHILIHTIISITARRPLQWALGIVDSVRLLSVDGGRTSGVTRPYDGDECVRTVAAALRCVVVVSAVAVPHVDHAGIDICVLFMYRR